ncbi:hypothetical protein I5M27_12955 [Adhaeribacter sp. BT258]|uniref:Uncharacterized protein n=1 Tax=Adhaeribacter terrigena TaxID=2793070 RepID=A0ABS1C3Z5_9BACT|nr:hypothetical protein [Adhaeribacter terrigena]MBK0403897.1 hypothetical protein [Adhaeribacter terrigena]
MKQLTFFLLIFVLTAFNNSARNNTPFKVEIAYRALPDPMTTEYIIDNKKMYLNHVIYDNQEASYQSLNKSTYKDFDRDKIISFLTQTNWSDIPAQIGTTAEGQHYIVKIEINNQVYNFDIRNTYHPTFASLFTICNEAIPSKEKREKYALPYK